MFRRKLYCVIHYGKHDLFNYKGYVLVYLDKRLKKFYMKVDLETFYQLFRYNKMYIITIVKSFGDVI